MAKKTYITLEIWPYNDFTTEFVYGRLVENGISDKKIELLYPGKGGDEHDSEKTFSPNSIAKACFVEVEEKDIDKVSKILDKHCPGTSFMRKPDYGANGLMGLRNKYVRFYSPENAPSQAAERWEVI